MTGVIGLLALALLPAIVLCIYVYRKDRVEKEPLGLLLKLMFFGALSCGPVGIMRAVMSVPGHMFFAVLMGYHYSLWHLTEKSAEIEEQLKSQGLIRNDLPPFSAQKDMALSLIMPIAAHGFYNTCCSVGTGLSMVVLFAFLIFMYIHCFKKIKKMSLSDGFENKYAGYLINKKYPGARIVVQEENYTVV